jgi:membrane associated rhomboid family serine protease
MFILPINRDNPVKTLPWTVFALIALNGVALFLTYLSPSAHEVFLEYGFIPVQHRPLTVLTSMFCHGGFWHYAGNMFFLWMFGNRVENMLGKALFLPAYLLCGAGGTLLHFFLDPTSSIPCIGASGAISGIAGIFFVLFPKANFDLQVYLGWWRVGSFPSRTYGAVGAWIAEQTILGIITQMIRISSVAFWAHVGGFATGLAAGGLFWAVVPDSVREAREGSTEWYNQDWFNRERESDLTQLKL